MKTYVFYHASCYDGFGAAYSAWKALKESAEYIPVSYGKPVPEIPDGSTVFIVDFSYPADDLLALAERMQQVYVLDHHKTAKEALEPLIGVRENLYIEFDMERSGALMTWDYFFQKGSAPALIKHISDRDLWKFEMMMTKEVHAALTANPMDFELWDEFATHEGLSTLKAEGAAMLKMKLEQVNKICEKAYMAKVGDFEVPVVNTSLSWSEVGHKLLELYPEAPFAASFTVFEDKIMWSLRSEDHREDVSAVAKKFGGGGHRNAAGFMATRF